MKPKEISFWRKEHDIIFYEDCFKVPKFDLVGKYKTLNNRGHINYNEAYLLAFADLRTIDAYYFSTCKKIPIPTKEGGLTK